jgi:hypothetical protein
MSVATTSQSRQLPTSEALHATPAIASTHTIRWTVSARALAAVRPDLVSDNPRSDITLTVVTEVTDRGFSAAVSVHEDARTFVVESIRGSVERAAIGATELLHLDAPELVVTLRRKVDGYETLYARLPLLARWGIAGGRYELVP